MIRIIFVDDEAMVLSGLQRILRRKARDWRMEFFNNGVDALASIANEKCDVIVSDMRMPKMDGVELLTKVRKSSPGTIRIGLSGQFDTQMIYRCIKNAHQYLAKPCSAEQLIDTVNRVSALQELVANERVRSRIAGMKSVPMLPESYKKLIDELQNIDPSMQKVSAIVEADASVSAKVLQIVNSAYFGLPSQINSSRDAVTYLGIDVIKNLVLASGIFSQFDLHTVKALRLDSVWSHSITIGALAQKIAFKFSKDKAVSDFALTSGLLSSIGILVMATDNPGEMAGILKEVKRSGLPQWKVEIEMLGYSHMEVGALLTTMWGLPNEISEAICYYQRPNECAAKGFSPLTAVHVADAVLRSTNLKELNHLDTDYIDKLNLADHIDNWRSMVDVEESLAVATEKICVND